MMLVSTSKANLAMSLALGALISRPAAASDAYDDEEEQEQPEGFRSEEEEESEKVEESLEAGGLDAPEAMPESGDERSQIEKDLDEAEEKDSGRGLEFVYLNGELGYQNVSLTSVSRGTLLAEDSRAQGGALVYGAGVGARVLYFTLGARFRRTSMKDFNLWSLVAEAAVRVPRGKFEPYASLAGGYASTDGLSYASLDQDAEGDLKGIGGFDLRLAGGLDYYFSDSFSIGGQVGGDMLFLSRPASDEGDVCDGDATCPYDEEGSSIGMGMTVTLLVGLHF